MEELIDKPGHNVWFMSDPHFGHKNMVRGCSAWNEKGKCRDFASLEEHDTALVDTINKYVMPTDVMYCTGDWSFGGIENIFTFRNRLQCDNIHLTLGNHDHHILNNRSYNGTHTQTLFSSVNHILQKKIHGQSYVMCHYAMRTWDKASHGTIMLYGHSHGSLPQYVEEGTNIPYKTMDIGVDVAFEMFGEYRPFHIDEITAMMQGRALLNIDHHGG